MAHNLPYAHDHEAARLPRGDRRDPAARADRRDRRAGHVHAGGGRADERDQRAAGHLRAVESDVAGRVHGGAGLRLERRPGGLRERQPVRAGDVRRHGRSGRRRATTPTSFPASASAPSPAAPARCPTSCSSSPRARSPRLVRPRGSRRRRALSAAQRDPEDLAGDRDARRDEGVRAEAGARKAALATSGSRSRNSCTTHDRMRPPSLRRNRSLRSPATAGKPARRNRSLRSPATAGKPASLPGGEP